MSTINLEKPSRIASRVDPVPQGGHLVTEEGRTALAYIQQVYALLAGSLILSVAAGYVGMSLSFPREHPFLMIFLQLGALLLAMAVRNTATLFLFTGISGLALGPLIALYVSAGLSAVVGQAIFLTGGAFVGLTFFALTTRRDLSIMGSFLFAGLLVLVVASLINLFLQSSVLGLTLASIGALVFSGLIVYETQEMKRHPWQVPPAVAALSMYLNVLNLFVSLLRLLGIMGSDD